MNECLVTKLKSSVNDESLPLFNKMRIFYEYQQEPTANTEFIRLTTGENPVKLISTSPFKDSIYAGKYEVVVPAKTKWENHVTNKVGGATVTLESVYDVLYTSLSLGRTTNKVDFNSFLVNCKCIEINLEQSADFTIDFAKCKNTLKGISAYNCKFENVEYLSKHDIRRIYTSRANIEKLIPYLDLSKLEEAAFLPLDLSDFPVSLRRCDFSDSIGSGSVESYVEKLRASGRTSGSIYTPWITSNYNITFNNMPIKQWASQNGVISSQNTYLVWTSNSITIQKEKPADYVAPTSLSDLALL